MKEQVKDELRKEDFNDLISISKQHISEMQQFVKPLQDSFGIDGFWYYTLSPEGDFTYLTSHPELAQYYYENELYKHSPYLRHPKYTVTGAHLLSSIDDVKYLHCIDHLQDTISMYHPFTIIEKVGEVTHGFGFAATYNKRDLPNLYFNYLPVLTKYCKYLIKKTEHLRPILEDRKVNLGARMGRQFFNQEPLNRERDLELRLRFLKALGYLQNNDFLKVRLTPREKDCLKSTIQGKTAQQIGELLKLSSRTIEHYLEKTKHKLNCKNKSELIEKGQLMNDLGLLG